MFIPVSSAEEGMESYALWARHKANKRTEEMMSSDILKNLITNPPFNYQTIEIQLELS